MRGDVGAPMSRRTTPAYAQQVAAQEPLVRDLVLDINFRSENRELFVSTPGLLHARVMTDPTHQTSAKRAALLMRVLTARPQEIDEMDLP